MKYFGSTPTLPIWRGILQLEKEGFRRWICLFIHLKNFNELKKYFFILLCFLLASCSGTKHLPAGEKLYTGAKIKLETTDNINKRNIKKNVETAVRPAPNKSFLGLRPRLWLYMSAGENPHTKLGKWLRK